mmetsp:Transcript_6694/g.10198  ORF Transcript_6694/g.10198 Transcript_6694/m.10198 type:complete len:115 (-) Transcript_6694:542-886(-)
MLSELWTSTLSFNGLCNVHKGQYCQSVFFLDIWVYNDEGSWRARMEYRKNISHVALYRDYSYNIIPSSLSPISYFCFSLSFSIYSWMYSRRLHSLLNQSLSRRQLRPLPQFPPG